MLIVNRVRHCNTYCSSFICTVFLILLHISNKLTEDYIVVLQSA